MKKENIKALIKQANNKELKRCPFPTGIMKISFLNLATNLLKISQLANKNKLNPVKLLIPVKANAYGSGIIPITKFLELNRLCDYFGVAHLQEALHLRNNGLKMPILILGQTNNSFNHLKYIIENEITPTISNCKLLNALQKTALQLNKKTPFHIIVDTGMGRCGVLPQNLALLLKQIKKCSNLKLTGVMTHFPLADESTPCAMQYTNHQVDIFQKIQKSIQQQFSDQSIIFHTTNSGALLKHAPSIIDMIRPGIAFYGYPGKDQPLNLKPIMTLTTNITLIKKYPLGSAIGYGGTYKTGSKNERIAIVPIGYGDGLSRSLSNKLTPILNGKKVPSVGRISMDQLTIKVDKKTRVGDLVTIIGGNNKIFNTAYDLADQSKTITYEVLCNLGNSSRLRKVYE